MTKEKSTGTGIALKTVTDLQVNYRDAAKNYMQIRFADNPEFQKKFIKTFSDMVFSQSEEMLETLAKIKQNTLLNAVFVATEAGASFAKKEISLLPFQAYKKISEKGVERKVATGEFDAVVIFDINFQKQQLLKLQNCKKFFTAEVHEGVKVIEDLETGNVSFSGENDVTKPTIGYYAAFITDEGEKYDKFMTCAEIIERAKFSPHFKAENYKQTGNNIHFEKLVVRNLIKEIPKVSNELRSIIGHDEVGNAEFTEFVEVVDEATGEVTNKLEEAKRDLATKELEEPKKEAETKTEAKTESKTADTAQDFF